VAEVSALGENQPMSFVSWLDAKSFCEALTEKEREAGTLPEGYKYSLPSEAQWEYACRAGTTTVFSYGDTLTSKQANFYGKLPYGVEEEGDYLEKTSEVKSYEPNPWGIYDMHGNVYEWCLDWYGEALPGGVDPKGVDTGDSRIIRGGTWNRKALSCRAAYRYSTYDYVRSYNIGFRVALVPEKRE
jgi:formylglycine-generating enzyme